MWADKIKGFTTWTLSIVAGTALAAGAAVVASGHLNSQAAAPSTSAPSQSAPKPQTTPIVSTGSTSDVRYTDSEAPTTMPVSTSTSPRPVATPTTIVRERHGDSGRENEEEHEYSGGDDN
jgi:cytoskeletal protein RodZ